MVHDLANILGVEAFSGLKVVKTGTVNRSPKTEHPSNASTRSPNTDSQDTTPLGIEYETQGIDPADLALVPILRSGLGMVDGK